MRYVVTAGFVTAETAVQGGRAAVDIRRGAVLPADVPAETVRLLLARGDIEAEPRVILHRRAPDADIPDGPIPALLAWVGGDVDRARRALAAELAKGDRARKGVMEPLTAVLSPSEQ